MSSARPGPASSVKLESLTRSIQVWIFSAFFRIDSGRFSLLTCLMEYAHAGAIAHPFFRLVEPDTSLSPNVFLCSANADVTRFRPNAENKETAQVIEQQRVLRRRVFWVRRLRGLVLAIFNSEKSSINLWPETPWMSPSVLSSVSRSSSRSSACQSINATQRPCKSVWPDRNCVSTSVISLRQRSISDRIALSLLGDFNERSPVAVELGFLAS
jgi:hypothetical protein